MDQIPQIENYQTGSDKPKQERYEEITGSEKLADKWLESIGVVLTKKK